MCIRYGRHHHTRHTIDKTDTLEINTHSKYLSQYDRHNDTTEAIGITNKTVISDTAGKNDARDTAGIIDTIDMMGKVDITGRVGEGEVRDQPRSSESWKVYVHAYGENYRCSK